MKNVFKILLSAVTAVILFTACNKSDETVSDNSIEGRYIGTLTNDGLKSASATADVTKTGDEEIEVHCFSDELDTTFMLNYYEDHDSVMVCLEGDAFQEMYGHILGQGHMMGGMMGDIGAGETEWMHHLSDEHLAGDEHFGGFDTMNHTFGYRFGVMVNGETSMFSFQGTKTH